MSNSGDDDVAYGYVFADLGQLDDLVRRWTTECDSIVEDGSRFRDSAASSRPPTADVITAGYFDALRDVFVQFIAHNRALRDYSMTYVKNLGGSRDAYSETDWTNAGHYGIDAP